MSPDFILYGFLAFFACLASHVLIWRIRVPKNDAYVLFLIFLIIPGLIFSGIAFLKLFYPSLSVMKTAYVFLLHLSLSLIYISSYPAAQAISPSLDILLIVASSESKRMGEEDIIKRYGSGKMIMERVADLANYSLIIRRGEYFELKPAAKVIVQFFILYRKMLGLPAGEG